MDRLIAANTVAVGSGDVAPATGTPGQATDGNPATNTPATRFPSYAFNAIQEEMVAVILAGGLALNRNNNAQMLAAIKAIAAGYAQSYAGAQYRLSNSSAVLALRPYGGNVLMIPGIGPVTIPAAGVSLAATGLTAGTTYFIYATVTSGNLTLEASTTGHSTDATTGIEIKTGDATRVLVGMERASTATAWLGLCRSWRNDPGFSATAVLTSSNGTSSTAYAELNPVIRTGFLLWANEKPTFSASGGVITTAANVSVWTAFAVDSATAPIDGVSVTTPQSGNVYPAAFSLVASPSGLAEGYHYLTMLVKVGTSTASWVGDTNVGNRSSITVSLPPRS